MTAPLVMDLVSARQMISGCGVEFANWQVVLSADAAVSAAAGLDGPVESAGWNSPTVQPKRDPATRDLTRDEIRVFMVPLLPPGMSCGGVWIAAW